MRKVVAAEHVSLDGVMEAPERWHFAYDNDEINQAIGAGFAASDALLTPCSWAASSTMSGRRTGRSRTPGAEPVRRADERLSQVRSLDDTGSTP